MAFSSQESFEKFIIVNEQYKTNQVQSQLLDSEDNIGPNINIKFPKKILVLSKEQKDFFKSKIEQTKKTELCKNWVLLKDCYYKDKCSFAHGELELRKKKTENPKKIKIKECKSFSEKSYCCFGNRCKYLHVISNHRLISYKKILVNFCEGLFKESLKEENNEVEFDKLIEMINQNRNKLFLM